MNKPKIIVSMIINFPYLEEEFWQMVQAKMLPLDLILSHDASYSSNMIMKNENIIHEIPAVALKPHSSNYIEVEFVQNDNLIDCSKKVLGTIN